MENLFNFSDFENNSNLNVGVRQYLQNSKLIRAFSIISSNTIFLLDFHHMVFDYVSGNQSFLCGYSPREIQEMGFEYYSKFVLEKDFDIIQRINEICHKFYVGIPQQERTEYFFTHDFHLKKLKDMVVLVNQKFIPLSFNPQGQIWKALCVVSLSKQKNSGNIKVQKANSKVSFVYDLGNECWRRSVNISLTEREKQILRLSMKGYRIKEIAESIYLSESTIKFHRAKIFQKLNVSNISEATCILTNSSLI